MHTLSGTLHNAWKKLRTDMTAPAHADLAFWSVVFIFFIYAASVPLATETQSTLAWTLVVILYVLQANFERIERHAGEYLK